MKMMVRVVAFSEADDTRRELGEFPMAFLDGRLVRDDDGNIIARYSEGGWVTTDRPEVWQTIAIEPVLV